ncbi:MAG: acetate--CoA ligase family protein, partial [Sciscionella sp.]
IAQLFDTALLLANQPLPEGPRIAVVGNSTAIGVLAADTALAQGLSLAREPVDTGAQAGPARFAEAVAEALADDEVDALVVVFVPPLVVPGAEYARALREAVASVAEDLAVRRKPIVSTFLAVEGVPAELAVRGPDGTPSRGSIPSYPSPERAVMALVRAVRYAQWSAAAQGSLTRPHGIDTAAARQLVRGALSHLDSAERGAGEWLDDVDAVRLLACYGVHVAPFLRAVSSDDAVAAAKELGYPVVLKSVNEQMHHRIDMIGVKLDLLSADAVRGAYPELVAAAGTPDVYVQPMAPKGVACALGLIEDPSFGSLVSFGLSGMISDLVGDRAYRAVPLTDSDASSLVRAPKAAPLLTGYRGLEPTDIATLEDLALRISALAEDLPEVRSLTLEPVLASVAGAVVASARIRLGDPRSRPDTGPRRLRSLDTSPSLRPLRG